MNLLVTILKAAHCRSTHHHFAVDALPIVTTPRGRRLCDILLKHHRDYLIGAKDPDTKFRDFRNHVVHVKDNYWGGAPQAAQTWYNRLIEHFDHREWAEAAYATGVLSHYFTDPLMPLHTAQSEIESVVHRPMEWSVCKSYSAIYKQWGEGEHQVVFQLSKRPSWLPEAIKQGAEVANRYYSELISRYDLEAGSRKPTEGFDLESIEILAGLFGVAITGWANILERIASETTVEFPKVSLAPAAMIAGTKAPMAWITRAIEAKHEQREVKAIFEEFRRTGTLVKHLPREIRTVRRERKADRKNEQRLAAAKQLRHDRAEVKDTVVQKEVVPAETTDVQPPVSAPTQRKRSPGKRHRQRKPRLSYEDKIVDAPSIGRKTAKRFHAIGIHTVGEFLDAHPAEMAFSLETRWITEGLLAQWQSQARLVCSVASLCGYKAQLLVGVEIHSAEELATRNSFLLHREIEGFAQTSAGKRVLRSSKVPKTEDVQSWIDDASDVIQAKISA